MHLIDLFTTVGVQEGFIEDKFRGLWLVRSRQSTFARCRNLAEFVYVCDTG